MGTGARVGLLVMTAAIAACGTEVVGGSGAIGGAGGQLGEGGAIGVAGGNTGSGTTASSSSGSTSSSSSTSGGGFCAGAGTGLAGSCAPSAAECHASTSQCLPAHENGGAPQFGLRITHLRFASPIVLTKGIVKSVLEGAVLPQQPACNLNGTGTFSWLLRFDTVAGTLVTGGAKPVADPKQGYAFLSGASVSTGGQTFALDPVKLGAKLDASCKLSSTAGDVNLPVYLDAGGSQAVILPLRGVRFQGGPISPDHSCIGAYNAATLDPASSCLGDDTHPTFSDGAQVDAFIGLEEADAVDVASLNESLCVLLSGDPATYGNGAQPVNRCRRDATGKIVFAGDWCTATKQPATGGCADAVEVQASFAASGVAITN